MNYAELAAGSAAQREALADRLAGKSPEPVIEEPDPDAKCGEVTESGEVALGNLTDAERAEVIAKAEEGDAVALAIVEKALADSKASAMQAGDAGVAGKRGGQDPWAIANARIMKAFRAGRARQLGL